MSEDTIILEVMLELAEDENKDLRLENEALWKYVSYLEHKNRELLKEYNFLLNPDNRKN
jgi:hypothetical protein